MAGQDLEVEDGEEKVALYNISLRLHEFPCLIMYVTLLYCCSSLESSCILECPSWLLFYLSLPNGFVLISDIHTNLYIFAAVRQSRDLCYYLHQRHGLLCSPRGRRPATYYVTRKTDDYRKLLFNNSNSETGPISESHLLRFAMPPRKKAAKSSLSLPASPSLSTSAIEGMPSPATPSSLRQRRSQNTDKEAHGKDNVEFNVRLKKNVSVVTFITLMKSQLTVCRIFRMTGDIMYVVPFKPRKHC